MKRLWHLFHLRGGGGNLLVPLIAFVVLEALVLVALTVLAELDLVAIVSLRERGIWMELKVREGMVDEEKMLVD
jgi:hypothetical protein